MPTDFPRARDLRAPSPPPPARPGFLDQLQPYDSQNPAPRPRRLSTATTPRRRPRCRRLPGVLYGLLLACYTLLGAAFFVPVAVAAKVPVPTTPNFRFDGQHSDFAQQYYRRHLAGESVPQISRLKSEFVPEDIRAQLSKLNVRWGELPGLLQRALLWDHGYVLADGVLLADGNPLVRIRTRCGRSMAQIFVGLKAYERIGCSPKMCSVPTGEITYRHKSCEAWQASAISLCAAEDAIVSSHSDMWGVGADDDLVPDVALQRHTWNDGQQLMYSLHAVAGDVAYNFCPARPSLIIPCTPYTLESDPSKWCAPVPGAIVTPWLHNYAASKKPHNTWIIFEIVLIMLFLASMIYGTCNHLRNKENAHMLELELEELREALLVWRQGARKDKASDALTAEADAVEDLETALDAAACEYFDSSIGFLASAHLHESRDLLECSRRSFSLSLVQEESESGGGLLESSNSIHESFGLGASTSQRRFDRSISSSSAISLLSGRRSQVALRSFHLFESHSLIRRRRVPFRDIQFNELLSQGTSGEVWRCTLRGQEVAVKQLLPTKRRMLKEMELFMAEVYLLSQLLHPNIVTLVGVAWNTLEHVVMIQEWMQRGDLQGFLKQQREQQQHGRPRMPTLTESSTSENDSDHEDEDYVVHEDFTWQNDKLEIALSVARALAYLHGLTPQLLHRDVKSKNVLLSDAMEVKLCDFGISRRKHHMDEDETNLTVTEAAGTMSWTAPEVLLGDDYGEKVDIYSYGIMLCEVDTCVLPYHDAESMASRLIYHPLRLMKMVTSTGLRPAISPKCPPKIASLIHACLDGDPDKRPAAHDIVTYLSSNDIV